MLVEVVAMVVDFELQRSSSNLNIHSSLKISVTLAQLDLSLEGPAKRDIWRGHPYRACGRDDASSLVL